MSEQILERHTTGLPGDPGLSMPDEPPVQRGARNRTFMVVAAAVIAGLVLGGVFLFVMKPGSSEDVLAPAPNGNPGAAAAAAPAGEAAPVVEQAPVKSTTRLTSRDPFAPLVAKKPPAPAPAPAAAAPSTGSASSPGPAPVSTPAPATGGTISALSISPLGNAVTLKLDGKKYEVDEGESFAKSYRLYDIFNENCAGFLYGDQNAVVCEGDSVAIG
jgi:hypothetical protein